MVNIEHRKQQWSDFWFNTKDSITKFKNFESNIKIKEISYTPIIIENLIWATAIFLAGSRLQSISFRQVSIYIRLRRPPDWAAHSFPCAEHWRSHVLTADLGGGNCSIWVPNYSWVNHHTSLRFWPYSQWAMSSIGCRGKKHKQECSKVEKVSPPW